MGIYELPASLQYHRKEQQTTKDERRDNEKRELWFPRSMNKSLTSIFLAESTIRWIELGMGIEHSNLSIETIRYFARLSKFGRIR